MNTLVKKLYAVLFCLCVSVHAAEETIDIKWVDTDLIRFEGVDAKPDAKGFVLSKRVVLPAFSRGCYYRPYGGGGHEGGSGNRIRAISFRNFQELTDYGPENPEETDKNDLNNVDLGQFLLLELKVGGYMALMPLAETNIMSAFYIRSGQLILKSGHFGTESVKGDINAMAIATGSTPYEATHKVWKKAFESGVTNTDWRSNKVYPEVYEYLGWCSWEHYRRNINTEILRKAVKTLEESPVPFRWLMVDDGYHTQENGHMINFQPDRDKFPNGWHDLTSLKRPDGIRWMGLWSNMLGYMAAISLQQDMDLPEGTFAESARGGFLVPNGTPAAAKAFYDEMARTTKEGGFDFTKVDFQARALYLYYGMENPVRFMRYNNLALEEACHEYLDGLLNCIAQTHVNIFNTKYSAVTRSSKDYSKTNPNEMITYQSLANHLWMGQIVWGDMDMFHSNAKDANFIALARAISGGPVYVSDEPSVIEPKVLLPFCDSDGKLFRSDAPAVPLPESFFFDPLEGEAAFRVVAPTSNRVAAIGLFNFSNEQALTASVSGEDYRHAGEQLQPYSGKWELPKGGLVVYDQQTRKAVDLSDAASFGLEPLGAKLLMLYPKTKGWAVIGRTDKYLAAAAVEINSVTDSEICFTLSEYGPFAVWSEKGVPNMKGVEFTAAGNGLYFADVPVEATGRKCVVVR